MNIQKITKEPFDWENIVNYADLEEIQKLKEKYSQDLLVVIGIGGSYLGAKAVIDALKDKYDEPKVLFIGESLSSLDLEDTLNYLKTKDFRVNVISKSGSTLETRLTFHFIHELMIEKYGDERHDRIIVTTDKNSKLYNEAKKYDWDIFTIPKNVGGRFSVFTPVGLFPIAVAGFDVIKLLEGVKNAYSVGGMLKYSSYRFDAYKKGKKIEILSIYEPRLETLGKWWQQLYGESEGKDGKGLFPVYSVFTRDLHSLGQMIQEGERNIVQTSIFIENVKDKDLEINNFDGIGNKTLNEVNKIAFEGTKLAHSEGGVSTYTFLLSELDEFILGGLMAFFMKACIISADLIKVNPYGQPGVELYKQNMMNLLNK